MASPAITQSTTCGSTVATASTSNLNFSDADTQIICVVAHDSNLSSNPADLTIDDTQSLVWVLRAFENVGNQGGFDARQAFWVWTAETGGPVTTTITIMGASGQGKEAVCFGVKGLNDPSAPFDSLGIVKTFATSGAPRIFSYSTHQSDDLIAIFAMGIDDPGATLSPAGYTNFASIDEGDGFSFIEGFYKSVSAPQSAQSATSPNSTLGYMVLLPFTADVIPVRPSGAAAVMVGV